MIGTSRECEPRGSAGFSHLFWLIGGCANFGIEIRSHSLDPIRLMLDFGLQKPKILGSIMDCIIDCNHGKGEVEVYR